MSKNDFDRALDDLSYDGESPLLAALWKPEQPDRGNEVERFA